MHLRKILYCSLFLLITSVASYAQVSVQFLPAIHGQDIQSLTLTRLLNTSSSSLSVLTIIKVREINTGDVVRIKTGVFTLNPGINQINRAAFSNASFSFSKNHYGNITKQSGKFPEGEYEFCIETEVVDKRDPNILPSYEQCFIHQLQPLTPLLLISPSDGDAICNKRPDFNWQPPMPMPANTRFRLILSEVKEKQDGIEAISFNQPIINQGEIHVNHLSFPINIPDLKEGKKYVWQITAYTNKTILKKSEIWEFAIKCSDDAINPVTDSYRELKDIDDGNYYIARNYLHFSINNPYTPGTLSYSIECVSDPKVVVKNLPKLNLIPGLNKYDLDLTENYSFKDGKEYLLKVFLPNNRQLRLRFIYKNDQR